MGRRKRDFDTSDGFEEWGGYKKAKVSKLDDQFQQDAKLEKISDIFKGVAIMVNGITRPPADELKKIMAQHGGIYHMYQLSSTTHIICSNLATVKIRNMGTKPVVKPSWIIESLALGRLIDFRRYLLYTHQSISQPKLGFPVIDKPSCSNVNIVQNNYSNISPSKSPDMFEDDYETIDYPNDDNTSSKNVQDNSNSIISNNNKSSSTTSTKTASDPNFLEEFYNNSRLHLISTLGAEYKQLVCQIRDKHDGFFLGRQKLISNTKGQRQLNISNIIQDSQETVIMHIDMDCFFVSVGLKSRPDLIGKPVAIAHARQARTNTDKSESRSIEFAMYEEKYNIPSGGASRVSNIDGKASMSEIASCSYEARKCGVKNGMFLGKAAQLCPDLITLPYDFEGYKEVSYLLYQTIASYTVDIEAVSCDEMYVNCTDILKETGLTVLEWATHIRQEITSITGCPCSTGFGSNRLQARLATRKAKPNGQFHLTADIVEDYMSDIPLSDLPGVGRATLAKLVNLGLTTCGDLQISSLKILQSELGAKIGETLMDQAKGIDKKPLNYYQERKSVSAEINYGIRFKSIDECWNFLQSLSQEVYNRLQETGMRSRCLTLKLMVRAENAPVETAKFLGHGVCDNLSKSSTSNQLLNSAEIIFKEAKNLYEKLNAPYQDLRGVGIQLSKLEKSTNNIENALSKFLVKKNENEGQKFRDISNDTIKSLSNTTTKMVHSTPQKSKNNNTTSKTDTKKSDNLNTSKRGRPKGVKNKNKTVVSKKGKTPLKKNLVQKNTLSSMFQARKVTPQSTPSKQDIDIEVLKELPEDIRNQIIQEYGLTSEDLFKHSKPKISQHKSQDKTAKTKNEQDSSPFATLSWEEIRPIIRHWINSETEPSKDDAEMIAQHFKKLALNRKIDTLPRVFNFLHRVFSSLDCLWHNAYFTIVDITQRGMLDTYGNILAVNTDFGCCKM